MARTELQITTINPGLDDVDAADFPALVRAVDDQAAQTTLMSNNAALVAGQFGYQGVLNVGALEDEIRFYLGHTVMACLELGKRLLILKELTPHGEFIQRAQLLGFDRRLAHRLMTAAIKFPKAALSPLLKAAGNQSKLLELLILDDGDLEALDNGGTVCGLNLDAIEKMATTELRKALRDSRADLQAKDALIQKKDEKINALDQKLTRKLIDDADKEPGQQQLDDLSCLTRELAAKVSAALRARIVALFDEFGDPPRHIRLAAAQSIAQVVTAAYGLADDLRLDTALELDAGKAHNDPARQDALDFMAWQAAQVKE